MSDSITADEETARTYLMWDIGLLMNLDRKGRFQIGWAYGSMSVEDSGGSTASYTMTEMGPKLGLYLDKERTWGLFATYNLISTATYLSASGGTEEEWRGTSLKAEFGYTPNLTETIVAGLRLNYHTMTYSEQLVGASTFSAISKGRAVIYPTFIISWRPGEN